MDKIKARKVHELYETNLIVSRIIKDMWSNGDRVDSLKVESRNEKLSYVDIPPAVGTRLYDVILRELGKSREELEKEILSL